MINWMKFKPLYFLLSLLFLIISLYSIIFYGFNLSVEFTGGTSITLLNTDQEGSFIADSFSEFSVEIESEGDSLLVLKTSPMSQAQLNQAVDLLQEKNPDIEVADFESVGPALGQETLRKTLTAIGLAALVILLYVSFTFKELKFGVCAILAMLHDTFILMGAFSILGHFFGAELDALFVTALLTILSSSVHDTVVTFDRIRELKRQNYKIEWVSLANQAVTETLNRSINNSMTIIFMLLSLVLLGGSSTKWFATALLIGVICGTYSSTAVAIPLVLFWKKHQKKK
jgi:preprotein translocase subunit SecF